ncbi:unnamed protein product [Ceutorhynchus assimilis]|uniref:KASH domain-containing protein n=1 Tax=Ceutorhynchus assimilis TaxID=467358 RepID=A0A9N9Q7Y5_9CUCU|nr:unnamed protein product [Ceutorhynchus assimilis]
MSNNTGQEETNGIDVVDGAVSLGVDTSLFTQSNKKAPNLATYYFKHEDTDSDMDKIDSFAFPKTDCLTTSTLDETSEEEWTFTRPDNNEVTNNLEDVKEQIPKAKTMSEDEIRILVQKAEELVSPEKCRKSERSNSLKMSRVNKWLSLDKPGDSCDASAEEDEKESQTSEDFDTSTLRESQNTSYADLNRWCRSFSSQLDTPKPNETGINFLSISESALHRMNLSPKALDRCTAHSTNSFNINGTNSNSSTVEELSPFVSEKTSTIRRKKSKLKKKALFGKSDPYLLCSPGSHRQHRNLLIKSGSFSGYSQPNSVHERHSSSDPSAMNQCAHAYDVSTTSGADSEDDSRQRMPNFKIGLKQKYLCGPETRDGSPGKCSLNTVESNSLTEAWDNYQENYLSEPYSESHDSDAARRLLNFGEDYRNFIDSQSDWSALSDISPKFKRKVMALSPPEANEDSNSDEESLMQIINDSRDQLKFAQEVYDHVKGGDNNVTREIEDLVIKCDRHVALLSHIAESSDEYKMSAGDKAVTSGLLTQWKSLRIRSVKMQEYRKLQKEIGDLKRFITNLDVPDNDQFQVGDNPSENINNEIEDCKKILDLIKNQLAVLTYLNTVVHRFTLENQDFDDFSKCTLKAEISELYEMFDSAKTRTSTKLSEIENLLPAWLLLQSRLEQLQKDLKEDGKNLHLLDSVLTNGQFTDQTAICVRGVAKVLSESTTNQGYRLPEFFTEGSLSDSGISDEGSEHEVGERQHRLAAIKRLVRQLELGLSPDSRARLLMREKLSLAEEELKELQQKCKTLIVRTAAVSHPALESLSKKKMVDEKLAKPDGGDDDPGNEPENNRWFKRFRKASVAFQLVLLTFVCLSFLYEPQCCDYMNNYQWSFSPKLHYKGNPPI